MTAPENRVRPMIQTPRSAVSLLFRLIAVSALVIGLVFFVGWAYAYHYFAHFDVGLMALQLPAVTFLGFAFWAFQAAWWLLIPYALGALALAIYEPRLRIALRRVRAERPWSLLQLGAVVALAAFLLAWWIAGLGATRFFERQQADRFRDLPRVSVWPVAMPEDEALRALYAELPTGVYRVLLEDRERLFLIEPPPDGQPARVAVIELPWREVRSVRVSP